MSIQKVGPWDRAAGTLRAFATRFPQVVDTAVHREALRFEREMKLGVRNQNPGGKPFAELSPITVHLKGSSKALIDKGDLLRSIGTKKIGGSAWFVGVHRTAKNREGRGLANIAAQHEEGYVIRQIVTEKQARFFRALWVKGLLDRHPSRLPRKGQEIRIVVRARPFVKPVYDKMAPQSKDRIMRDVRIGMGFGGRLMPIPGL